MPDRILILILQAGRREPGRCTQIDRYHNSFELFFVLSQVVRLKIPMVYLMPVNGLGGRDNIKK